MECSRLFQMHHWIEYIKHYSIVLREHLCTLHEYFSPKPVKVTSSPSYHSLTWKPLLPEHCTVTDPRAGVWPKWGQSNPSLAWWCTWAEGSWHTLLGMHPPRHWLPSPLVSWGAHLSRRKDEQKTERDPLRQILDCPESQFQYRRT